MKKTGKNGKSELQVQESAKSYGFLFPTTNEELNEFDKLYGTSTIQLPTSLQSADFLFEEKNQKKGKIKAKMKQETHYDYAIAADTNMEPKEFEKSKVTATSKSLLKKKVKKKS